MTGCCDPREYDVVFTERYARRTARRYQQSGLDDIAGQMADFLTENGVKDTSVLEIGGGVGGLHMELLRRGAAHATNAELSAAYDAEAARLLAAAGLIDRVDRRIVDIAADPASVSVADVVVLHRVVCCYPSFQALLGAGADHAGRSLAFSYPRPHMLNRAQTVIENLGYAIRGQTFRTFVHSPDAMVAALAEHGLVAVAGGRSRMWQWTGAVRHD